MLEYIIVTESALDFCLINNGFTDEFLPRESNNIYRLNLSDNMVGYCISKEPSQPYFALIKKSCIEEIQSTGAQADDAYRRIARVVKGLKSPPIHLPRQWSEYHHNNLLAFFALPKGNSTGRWIADLDGSIHGVRFEVLASIGADIDLTKHAVSKWPPNLGAALDKINAHEAKSTSIDKSDALVAEIDLKAIGSASVVNNRNYEDWENHLSIAQKSTLSTPINSSIRIVGPAGSGKTLILCMRALKIARDPEVMSKGKKILIATHSWAMAERIDGVIDTLNGGIPSIGITVFPLLSLLELHAGHIGQQRTEVIGDDSSDGRFKSMDIIKNLLDSTADRAERSGVSEWISNGLRATDDSRVRLDLILNLYDEISGVLTASGVSPDDPDAIRQYINSKREDWMPPFLTSADRGFVISIYRDFIQKLIDRSSITTDQFVLDSIRVLETFTWRMRKETDGYDYILVDELQLFDPQERSSIELLGRSKKGVPFVTAEDPSQGVFSALNARPGVPQNELVYLDTVHRFNKEIFELIGYIYQKFPLNTLPLKIERDKKNGKEKPRLYTCANDDLAIEQAAILAKNINDSSSPSERICLATLGDVDTKLAEALEKLGLLVTKLASFDDVEQLAYSKRSIVVAPWQFVGGTQFSHVIVVAAAINQPQSQFGKLRELISVYLSCSRAAQSLNVVCSNYTPAVIREAKDNELILIMSLSQSALDNCTDIQYADLLRKPFEVNHGDQQYPVPEGLVDE